MDEERKGACIWKVLSVIAFGEGGRVHMEGVECVCMGRGRVCAYGRVECAYMEKGCVYMEGIKCACMGRGRVCTWKGWSVHREREDVCIWKGECACMGERVCAYGRVECVHGERVCICKLFSELYLVTDNLLHLCRSQLRSH